MTAAFPSNLTDLFLRSIASWPGRVVVADDRGQLTYKIVGKLASTIARRLLRPPRGAAPPGENVAIMLPTIKEFPAAYFGVLLAGCVPVPINFLLDNAELVTILEDAEVSTVITSQHFAEKAEAIAERVIYLEDIKPLQVLFTRVRKPVRQADPDDVATILYTSGTTGRPKGVELTHRNLTSNVEACMQAAEVTERDVVLGVLPFFHSFALTVTMNLVFAVGVKCWYMPRFVARRVLQLMDEEGITLVPLVPSMWRLLNRSADRRESPRHKLRVAIAGGEPLPRDVAEDFERIFGTPLFEGYGLTETSPVLSLTSPGHHKPGTVGPPLDNLEVAIVDDEGKHLGVEQDGEIFVRGPSIMRGYRNMPDETREVLDGDGWFHTGDIGRRDDEGFLRITGRKKEMIISSGENIYPREIEEALAAHEAVGEVAVIGVPDRSRGEMPYAFIVCNEGASVTEDELREHLRGRIGDYKIPRRIEIREELPHSPTGKILKRTLEPRAD